MSKLTKGLKKTGIIAAKVVGTTVLTATGIVSAVTEKMISVTGVEPLQDIAHGAKSASFNGIRKMWGAAPTEFERIDGTAEREKLQQQKDNALREMEKKINEFEATHPEMSYEQKAKINEVRNNINQEKAVDSSAYDHNDSAPKNPDSSKSIAEWDEEWISIGMLKNADLSPYNHCVGLYRHVINGITKYVGRAIELNNGGFRKRLSDYRRDSDSARKHKLAKMLNINQLYFQTDFLLDENDEHIEVEILYGGDLS